VNIEGDTTGIPTPQPVPLKATHCGENLLGKQWGTLRLSEASLQVWTPRMLEALARGNQGRQWHTLMDKVFSPKTLSLALRAVCENQGAPGVDGQTTQSVAQKAAEEIATIQRLLYENKYEPRPAKRVWIDKAGSTQKRPLGLPTVRDRIVQKSLHIILEPIFERDFCAHSYGFRPGRQAQQAVERVEDLLKEGYHWVVDADIKGYFDNIPQDQLMTRVREKIADGQVLGLLEKFLRQGVMESGKKWQPTESGTPQGAVMSPLLANIYLDPLDKLMEARGIKMTRFADDFILQCRTQPEAQEALEVVRQWMEKSGLELHPQKTKIVDATQHGGFEFVGWHFERGYRWPREKSQQQFKDAIRQKTQRSNGKSLKAIIAQVNLTVRGWGNYFRGGVRTISPKLDSWLRMRLRSILRKRDQRKGCGHGLDHNRYPNAYFAEHGLIFLIRITHDAATSPAKMT
jgi:RNA-directed DNA polymerase